MRRAVIDMSRDIKDVQFKTARDMLPELQQGLDRLKKQLEEEKEAAEA